MATQYFHGGGNKGGLRQPSLQRDLSWGKRLTNCEACAKAVRARLWAWGEGR